MNTPSTEAAGAAASTSERGQLFFASCVALVATSMIFSVRADILGAWEHYFRSSSEAIGFAILPAFWGFTIAIFIGGQLCDLIGMRALLGLAFVAHVVGTIMTIFAPTVAILGLATLIIGLGNGFVEAGINPLVATIHPDQKTVKLNTLHAWWPGGQIIGGLAAFFLTLLFVRLLGLDDPRKVA
ncbi:MAG: MFS transporter, partial [Armatimonadota bacterium]